MVCAECGMPVDKTTEYHPYAACLMFKGCHDSIVVQTNLDSVVAHGAWIENETRQPCDVVEFSSRMCEYGTKGCVRPHKTPIAQGPVDVNVSRLTPNGEVTGAAQ